MWVFDVVTLQSQQAVDNLKVVLDPVVYFLEKDFLFFKRCSDLFLGLYSAGDVSKYCDDAGGVSLTVAQLGDSSLNPDGPAVLGYVFVFSKKRLALSGISYSSLQAFALVGRQAFGDRLPDHLRCRPAKQLLCPPIPIGNDALQVGGHNGFPDVGQEGSLAVYLFRPGLLYAMV